MPVSRRRLTRGVGLLAVFAAIFVMAACESRTSAAFTGPSADAVAAELSGKGSGGSAAGAGLAQRNSGGSVTIDVTWTNPGTNGPLVFSVVMDTHSVELDQYDLAKLAVLRGNQGQEVRPQSWDAPPGGHHRSGTLTFPATDGSGKPLVGPGTKSLELVVRDVSGIKERSLKWTVAS